MSQREEQLRNVLRSYPIAATYMTDDRRLVGVILSKVNLGIDDLQLFMDYGLHSIEPGNDDEFRLYFEPEQPKPADQDAFDRRRLEQATVEFFHAHRRLGEGLKMVDKILGRGD